MADNIWRVAISSDAPAVDSLGDTLRGKGDGKGARALWTRLSDTAPSWREKLSEKLK